MKEPKTPLPWTEIPEHDSGDMTGISYEIHDQDFEYIVHACNAYPKLMAFVNGGYTVWDEDTANELLKELGEL